MLDITLLPSAKVPLIYDGDTVMTTEWYRFFWNVYGFTGDPSGAIPVSKGGTGLTSIGEHQLIIGTANNTFEPTILTGSGIAITYAPGVVNLAIGASGVTPGTYGSSSSVGQFTVNQYGAITAASNVSIGINASQIISGTIDPARISGSYTGITGVGVLTAGTWNANTIAAIYGGTGQSSYVTGDLLYASDSATLSKLSDVATGNALISGGVGVAPSWGKIDLTTHVTGVLPVLNGGTGQSSYTNGQLLIGNTTGNTLTKATLTAGSGVTITNGAGSITISATGSGGTVTSVSGTAPISVATGTTTPVISISQSTTSTDGYLSSTDWNTFNNKQPAGTYVTSISIASSNGFTGTSSGGATPSLTLATSVTGILKGNGTAISAATSGTDYAPATSGTSILYGNGAGGFSNVTIGTGVSFVGGTLSATGSGGTVTSVTGTSPVVSSGGNTPAISLASGYGDTQNPYASKTANYFLAAPNGSAGVPTFRAIVAADIPALSYVTSVSGTGSVNGITLTGTVTSSGSLTLGGTLSNIGNSQLTNSTISGVALGGNLFNLTAGTGVSFSTGTTYNGSAAITINATGTGGTVTSVSFTGGIVSVATATTTPALTVAGTSGGIPYFSSASTWASSAALAANALVIGGGAGVAPSTITTGTGVVTALGVNTGTAGAFVVNGGALGTPSSGTVTNLTGTAAINITGTAPAGNLTGTTLNSTVVTSSLTTVGTIGTGVWQGTAVGATYGGTGQTVYAVGDLLYASTTTAISKLADVATGNALISGGVGVAPSYGKIGLTTHISGTLPTANGGTNLTSFTANGILYASSTSALATGSALTFDGTNFATTGYASATSFRPTSSTVPTNGMYLYAANNIAFATNSTFAMNIDSAQNVGIGYQASTSNKITVYGDNGVSVSPVAGGSYLGALGVCILGSSASTATSSVARLYMTGNNTAHAGCLDLRSGSVVSSSLNVYDTSGVQRIFLNPTGLQYTTNTSAGYGSAIVNAWGASSNPGVLVGTTRSDGYAFQVGTGIALTSGLPSSNGTTVFLVYGSGGVSIGNTTDPGSKNLSVSGTVKTAGYTVATLPAAGTVGRKAYVTDATAPTFLGALTGGGAVKCPVFDNGTAWVAG